MKKTLALFIIVILLSLNVTVALAFSDQPQPEKWVYENFMILKNSGLLKGYPDNSFRGDNSATRYEMVEMTGRVLIYLENKIDASQDDKTYLDEETVKKIISDEITRKEETDDVYQAIRNLEKEFEDELAVQDLRITTLEDEITNVNSEVKDLEKGLRNTRLMAIAGIVLGLIGVIQ